MPIKWSAIKVSEAMDGIEAQLTLAHGFIAEAQRIAEQAKHIPNLPEYINQPRRGLSERLSSLRQELMSRVDRIRQHIPDGALEAERKTASYGSQQGLM